MKFCMSISVQDIRHRTHPTTHEKHEIGVFLHKNVMNFTDQEIIQDLRPENLQKPAQKYTNFNLNALIDPKLYIL